LIYVCKLALACNVIELLHADIYACGVTGRLLHVMKRLFYPCPSIKISLHKTVIVILTTSNLYQTNDLPMSADHDHVTCVHQELKISCTRLRTLFFQSVMVFQNARSPLYYGSTYISLTKVSRTKIVLTNLSRL
jgi:hypothetical protein